MITKNESRSLTFTRLSSLTNNACVFFQISPRVQRVLVSACLWRFEA